MIDMIVLVGRIAAGGNAYARMRDGRLKRIAGLAGDVIRGNLSYEPAIYVSGDEDNSLAIASLSNIRAVYFCEPIWAAGRIRTELQSVLRDHFGSLMLILDGNNVETLTEARFEYYFKRVGSNMFSRDDIYVIGILPMFWGSNV